MSDVADPLAPLDSVVSAERTPAEPSPMSTAENLDPTMDVGATATDSEASLVSTKLPFPDWGRYQILSFLGAGGMGTVYKARDPKLRRLVAIKFLRSGQADTQASRQRKHFEREAQAQARIEHPHICKIYEVGEVSAQPYIAMQLILGTSLNSLQQSMTCEEKVRVIHKVAESLQAAHSQHLIHRDLKPANIMVERQPDGTFWPYLMDFGLAREIDASTQTSMSLGGVEGTPAYMAPEQARGETKELDVRTDVYGLGGALYSILAERPPFVGSALDVLVAVLEQDPPRLRSLVPTIPLALETIVHKCLEKDPKRRYPSAQALADDLERYLEGVKIAARPPTLWRRAGRFAQRHKLLVSSAAAALVASCVLGVIVVRIRWQAAAQARLAQQLGQEIRDMEWMLRSARQLPLHDLEREKRMIRQRMELLQQDLQSYGKLSRGLAHYALGRGHLALHEYPLALNELEQALALGVQSAEVHYALGLALGKQFEQAMYEARLAGGGDWAKKQLQEYEPKYLTPAIASLVRSRAMKFDAPQYLEGLISYYQRDYAGALQHAAAAVEQTPWLFEASKLSGDVHLECALRARDSGHLEEAEREFAGAVKGYEAAVAVGRSDGEAYEGLAEAWVRQIEMAHQRSEPTDRAYAAAIEASNKLMITEPPSIAGPLKKSHAANMSMAISGTGLYSKERLAQCIQNAEVVLARQPGHPYASDVLASCVRRSADNARARGEDPEPLLRKAIDLLEATVKKYPHFLWGVNDLGNAKSDLGTWLQLHGNPSSKGILESGIQQYAAALALDPTFGNAPCNALGVYIDLVPEVRSEAELQGLLASAEKWAATCKAINNQAGLCFANPFEIYARAASRVRWTGQDPQPLLKRALENMAQARKVGALYFESEQHLALTYLVQASDLVRKKQTPAVALFELQAPLTRCFAQAPQDAICRTLAAQAEWVQADWLAGQRKPFGQSLQLALAKAVLATESQEKYPEAWQTLAETYLRLARTEGQRLRDQHVSDGLAALQKVFAINPHHALGLATQGALQVLAAQSLTNPAERRATAQSAVTALETSLANDPFLSHYYTPLLAEANALLN